MPVGPGDHVTDCQLLLESVWEGLDKQSDGKYKITYSGGARMIFRSGRGCTVQIFVLKKKAGKFKVKKRNYILRSWTWKLHMIRYVGRN